MNKLQQITIRKMFCLVVIALIIIDSIIVVAAEGSETIGSFQISGSGTVETPNSVSIIVHYDFNGATWEGNDYQIFEDIVFDSTFVGQTIVVTQANDDDFNSAVDVLTNGFNDNMYWEVVMAWGDGGTEINYFSDDSTINGYDFQGYSIDSFSLTIHELTFTDPDSIILDATMNVNGAIVPEPISSILFITGGVTLAGRRYLRRRK